MEADAHLELSQAPGDHRLERGDFPGTAGVIHGAEYIDQLPDPENGEGNGPNADHQVSSAGA